MIRLVFLAIVGCSAPGSELPLDASPPPALHLTVTALDPGDSLVLSASGATPGAAVYFFVGQPGSWCPPPLGGDCLDLDAVPLNIGPSTANASGVAKKVLTVPALTPGDVHHFQAGSEPANLLKSQVVAREVLPPCVYGDILDSVAGGAGFGDPNRITHDDHTVYVSRASMTLYGLDLTPTGVSYPSPYGLNNHGVRFNPHTGTLITYQFAVAPQPHIRSLDPATGATVVPETSTTGNTGSGFIDNGAIHLVDRAASGFIVLDATLTPVATWGGGGVGNGVDAVVNDARTRAFKLRGTLGGGQVIDVHDLTLRSRPIIGTLFVRTVPGSLLLDLAIDKDDTLYVTDYWGERIVAVSTSGAELGVISTPGMSPASVDYNPYGGALYIGYAGAGGELRRVCRY